MLVDWISTKILFSKLESERKGVNQNVDNTYLWIVEF